jgi:F-type H+-transporting ATPase subunit delta
MRGVSRPSLAQLRENLDSALQGRVSATRLGDELFSVVMVLDEEHGLRRALADPAKPGEEKAAVTRQLLHGKVTRAAEDLMADAASAKWASPGDFTAAVEELAIECYVVAAQNDGTLDDLEDSLFRFSRVISGQPDLRAALAGGAPQAGKQELVHNLLNRKVTGPALSLITQVATNPRGASPQAALDEAAQVAARRASEYLATVRVATPLDQARRSRLRTTLQAAYGKAVHLNVVLDPSVIGGMSVQIGDELIDGTASSRLAEVRRELAS